MLLTIITFIIILSLLVFVHELGHFMVARKLGVKAEEFGFGFPPRCWGVYKNEQGKWRQVWGNKKIEDCPTTVYSVNWIPLGGFVKIKGEQGEGADEQDSFAGRPVWQRAIMLAAGVIMNVVLAAVIIIAGFMVGLPQVIDETDQQARIRGRMIQIVEVLPDSPAAVSGIKLGDTILTIDRREFASAGEIQPYIAGKVGQPLDYQVNRGGEILQFAVTPEILEATGSAGIGIAIADTGIVSYPWYLAIWQGIKTTVILVWTIIAAFYGLLKGLIMGQGVSADLAGPVGIAAITGQVARMGFVYIMQFAALLSINLAIINFFPFPALDGGRFLFLLIEKIKGSPVKRELEAVIHNIGFVLLMILVLLVTFRDISRFGDSFKNLLDKIF